MGRAERICQKILNTLWVPTCLHCRMVTDGKKLCSSCLDGLQLLNPKEHCRRCFLFQAESCLCHRQLFWQQAALFDHTPPIATLIRAIESMPPLAKTLANLILLQLHRLEWSQIDYITWLPCNPFHFFKRMPATSRLLGEALGKALSLPAAPLLRERPTPEKLTFEAKKALRGASVLLLMPHLQKAPLPAVAHALSLQGAGELRVLALTMTIR